MKEYRVTEKQLEKLSLYLEELSGVHKDMMGDDGCVNLRDLDDARGKLNETIRELGYLVEDIENQPLETRKGQKTLLEVIGTSVIAAIPGGCPGCTRYSEAFRTAGYKQPDANCPRGADGYIMLCSECWERPAEPLEDGDHAR